MKPKRWISSDQRGKFSARRRKDFHFHDKERDDERAREGRELESRVEAILLGMVKEGLITNAVRHAPCSQADMDGKDFTIETLSGKQASFGITCSFTSYKRYFLKYPGQECLWLVTNQGNDEVRQMLVQLFERAA